MRSTSVCCFVVVGACALVAAGCNTNKGAAPGFAAAKEKTDWFGMNALAAMLKPDPKPMQTTEPSSKTDPTSLAHKSKPLGSDLYVHAARVYEKKGQFEAAEGQYLHALELNPQDTEAITGYGHCLDRQGKFDEAIEQYKVVVHMKPNDAAAHNDLGLCYARRGMINESLAELSRAVELDPQKPLYRNNIATVYVQIGRTPDALQQLMISDPPAVAHYNVACLLHQRGQSQAAGQHFAQAASLDPSLVMAREWAARLGAMPVQSQPAGPRLTNVRAADPAIGYQPTAGFQPTAKFQPASNVHPANVQPAVSSQYSPQAPATNWQPQPRQARMPDVGTPRQDMRWPQASAGEGSEFGVQGSDEDSGVVHAGYTETNVPPSPETAESYVEHASAAVDEEADGAVPTGPRY